MGLGIMGHGDVLLVLLSPRSSSERFGAGARPVHPIRVGSLRRTDSVAIQGIADIRRGLAARRSDANDPLCHSTINFAVMHTRVLAQRCGNVLPYHKEGSAMKRRDF